MVKPPKPPRSGCPISFGLDIFGDGWSLLVLRDLLFEGKRTFRAFAGSDERIASNILADRLRRLQAAGLIRRQRDCSDRRQVIYAPTEAGRALVPVLVELAYWGAVHDKATGAPTAFRAGYEADRDALVAAMRARAAAGPPQAPGGAAADPA